MRVTCPTCGKEWVEPSDEAIVHKTKLCAECTPVRFVKAEQSDIQRIARQPLPELGVPSSLDVDGVPVFFNPTVRGGMMVLLSGDGSDNPAQLQAHFNTENDYRAQDANEKMRAGAIKLVRMVRSGLTRKWVGQLARNN
jgi:hypothetical protein